MIGSSLRVLAMRFEDWLRVHHASAWLAAPTALLAYLGESEKSLRRALLGPLYFPRTRFGRALLRRSQEISQVVVRRTATVPTATLTRSLLIKPYVGPEEPGMLIVSFENELLKLAHLAALSELEQRYRMLFFPTWQPFYSLSMSLYEARTECHFFLCPSSFGESDLVSEFSERAHFLPFHAASWVRADLYAEPSSEKDIDLIMIANFSRRKRHWLLFRALQSMPATTRVVLAGVPMGSWTADGLRDEARLFGVEDQIDIVVGASDADLRDLLSRSRLFCALSHKEGSYIAVVEALMAGVPVAMMANAIVGSRAYIGEKTGFLLDPDAPLGPQLEDALATADGLDPRAWAVENVSAGQNVSKLNGALKSWSNSHGLEWSRDICDFYCEHFDFVISREVDRANLQVETRRIQEEFGLTLPMGDRG